MRYANPPICQIKQPPRLQIHKQFHPSKQQTLEKFSELSVFSVDKKQVVGASPS
jgi:hypothetical protein